MGLDLLPGNKSLVAMHMGNLILSLLLGMLPGRGAVYSPLLVSAHLHLLLVTGQ